MIGFQLELDTPLHREEVVRALHGRDGPPLLVLDTCQRLECYGLQEPAHPRVRVARRWTDHEAFERLARIAAGLESRILGELEVLGQVRNAYKQLREGDASASALDRMVQDALALARRARRDSGIDRNLTSLSGIAARTMLDRIAPGQPLAVVGSGHLAGSVVRYLGKRGSSPIRVTSRCPDHAIRLALEVGGFGVGMDDIAHLFDGVAGIICATAAPHPVIFPRHLAQALRPLHIIDLGVPPDCEPAVAALARVDYAGLDTIEEMAQQNVVARRERAEVAARIIRDGAIAWATAR